MTKSYTHINFLSNLFLSGKHFQKYLEVVPDELRAIRKALGFFLSLSIDWHFDPINWAVKNAPYVIKTTS